MSSEFTARQIGNADQWLASLEKEIGSTLVEVQKEIDKTGDPTIAYLRISRQVAHGLETGDVHVRGKIAMCYVAALFVLNKRKADK